MDVKECNIAGVYIITPKVFGDNRGYFFEQYSKRNFCKSVMDIDFVQDNISKSKYGVIRGLHFQKPPYAQSKLISVIEGEILDICVDIRVGSPTFGQYVKEILSCNNHKQLFIPKGFAHGFAVLSKEAIIHYKTDNFYAPDSEGGLAWDDPTINIEWPIERENIELSAKDKNNPTLQEIESNLYFTYNNQKEK